MLIGVLLAINIVVCLGLIGVVLLQRSEGGALGMGGGNTGFMTARGAGDLLTRITWILFSLFLLISLTLTILTGRANTGGSVTDRRNIKSLDTKSLNAAPAPQAPATDLSPSSAQPGAIQAPTPQINAPAPTAPQPSLLAPAPATEPAKKPAAAPKAAPKPAATAPATATAPAVAAPPAEQPKQ
jgi:preprotein translocase subunit SecG